MELDSDSVNATQLRNEIYTNEQRVKFIRETVDKDYQDFLQTLDRFTTIEDTSYNNKIIDNILKMQNPTPPESIEVTMLANGLHLANSTKNELSKDIKNLQKEEIRIRKERNPVRTGF